MAAARPQPPADAPAGMNDVPAARLRCLPEQNPPEAMHQIGATLAGDRRGKANRFKRLHDPSPFGAKVAAVWQCERVFGLQVGNSAYAPLLPLRDSAGLIFTGVNTHRLSPLRAVHPGTGTLTLASCA